MSGSMGVKHEYVIVELCTVFYQNFAMVTEFGPLPWQAKQTVSFSLPHRRAKFCYSTVAVYRLLNL